MLQCTSALNSESQIGPGLDLRKKYQICDNFMKEIVNILCTSLGSAPAAIQTATWDSGQRGSKWAWAGSD